VFVFRRKRFSRLEHESRVASELLLYKDRLARARVDDAHHAIVYAGPWSRTVKVKRSVIVDDVIPSRWLKKVGERKRDATGFGVSEEMGSATWRCAYCVVWARYRAAMNASPIALERTSAKTRSGYRWGGGVNTCIIRDGIDGEKPRKGANPAFAQQLIGNAWMLIIRSNDRMVGRKELKPDYIANLGHGNLG